MRGMDALDDVGRGTRGQRPAYAVLQLLGGPVILPFPSHLFRDGRLLLLLLLLVDVSLFRHPSLPRLTPFPPAI